MPPKVSADEASADSLPRSPPRQVEGPARWFPMAALDNGYPFLAPFFFSAFFGTIPLLPLDALDEALNLLRDFLSFSNFGRLSSVAPPGHPRQLTLQLFSYLVRRFRLNGPDRTTCAPLPLRETDRSFVPSCPEDMPLFLKLSNIGNRRQLFESAPPFPDIYSLTSFFRALLSLPQVISSL